MHKLLVLTKDKLRGGVGEVIRNLCRRLPSCGIQPVFYNPQPDIIPFATEEGVPYYMLPLAPGWKNPYKHINASIHLLAVAKKEQISIAHAHAVGSPLRSGLVLQSCLNIPAVVTSHGDITPAYRKHSRWSQARIKRTKRWMTKAAAMTHLNEGMKCYAQEITGIADESLIIPNGCDVKWWQVMNSDLPLPSRPYILAMGRLDKIKGFHKLLDAYFSLVQNGFEISLVFCGDGPERAPLMERARDMGFSVCDEFNDFCHTPVHICFCGYVSGELKRTVMQRCLFLAHPNQTSEAFPLVFVEAMAAAKAIVCYEMPTFRGIVTDRVNGLVVPLGDDVRFVNALAEMVKKVEERSRYELSNTLNSKLYDWDVIVDRYSSLYNELINNSKT